MQHKVKPNVQAAFELWTALYTDTTALDRLSPNTLGLLQRVFTQMFIILPYI